MGSFVRQTGQVGSQLTAQKIVFPAENSPAIKAPEFAAMHQYAGQTMTTGAQAQVYADHFIANHLKEIGGGQTYAQLSAKALAQPNNTELAAQVDAMFKRHHAARDAAQRLRVLEDGPDRAVAAIVSFIGAGLLLILSALGFIHARRAGPTAEIMPGQVAGNSVTTPA